MRHVVSWGHRGCTVTTACTVALTAEIAGTVGSPVAHAIDCNGSTLFINGAENQITVTTQGSSNTVIADNVVNDITVYGWDQTVLYMSGEPFVLDRGRELGMTNRIDRVPA